MTEELVPAGSLTATLAVKNASVNDEIGRAGASFGSLILTTGKAVAETQRKLNETGANTATEMANTLVDVVALKETEYDDEGKLIGSVPHVQHLPLINFMDPVFYKWSQVRVQGLFMASEFATAGSTTSISGSFNTSARINFTGVRGNLAAQLNADEDTNDSSSDVSYGNVRMNALLEPRADITVPKPSQVIRGPLLIVTLSTQDDKKEDPNDPTVLTAREMEVQIEYRRREVNANNGHDPIPGKTFSIDAPGLGWSYLPSTSTVQPLPPLGVTDSNGSVSILLRREFLDKNADTAMKDFVVTARIGILRNATTVNL